MSRSVNAPKSSFPSPGVGIVSPACPQYPRRLESPNRFAGAVEKPYSRQRCCSDIERESHHEAFDDDWFPLALPEGRLAVKIYLMVNNSFPLDLTFSYL